jgi:peptidoglycan/xylan/chitin deacetylase (PgdA/CDA1 family)
MSRIGVVAAAVATAVVAGCGQGASTAPRTAPSPSPSSSPRGPATPATPTPARPSGTSVRPTATTTAAALPAWLRGRVVTRLPTTRRVIALTFDCGAGTQGAASILATLAQSRVPATFFFTGRYAAGNPTIVTTVARRGYVVGDHTVSHAHLTQLSTASVAAEVTGGAAAIARLTGASPRPWFRFPYGEYDDRTLRIVNGLGYGAIGWTIDTRGWRGKSAGTAADVVARVRAALVPGAIVLMHVGANPDDHTTYDADALPAVIAMVRAAGYGFVTVAGPL